jgi:hypothetical protein
VLALHDCAVLLHQTFSIIVTSGVLLQWLLPQGAERKDQGALSALTRLYMLLAAAAVSACIIALSTVSITVSELWQN